VVEETGITCELGDELPETRYQDQKGRAKVVRYWLMRVVDDPGFQPNDEVDELRWVPPGEAAELLSYEHDRALVAAL
jgi:8-oxo-dGTP diphosphatase